MHLDTGDSQTSPSVPGLTSELRTHLPNHLSDISLDASRALKPNVLETAS